MTKPFLEDVVPVIHTYKELEDFLDQYPGMKFCLYLADKSHHHWEQSTSRGYLNNFLEDFIYLPVNIDIEHREYLHKVYDLAKADDRIVAINQTVPYKTNEIMDKWFPEMKGRTIDSLIKQSKGSFKYYSLNAPSFFDWFAEMVGSIEGQRLLLVGLKEIGEPVARGLLRHSFARFDIVAKEDPYGFSDRVQHNDSVNIHHNISDVQEVSNQLILINAAGKEGEAHQPELAEFLKMQKGLFIDLRPQDSHELMRVAQEHDWKTYSGAGITERNNYTLLKLIAEQLGQELTSFANFEAEIS